jgi:hypothetical protein
MQFFAFVRYWGKKLEYSETVHQLFTDFKKGSDSVRMEALYNIRLISLKQDALMLLFFNFAVDYAIRKVHENQMGMKLNGTHQLLVYADVNLL